MSSRFVDAPALDAEAALIFSLARGDRAGAVEQAVDHVVDWQRAVRMAARENALIALRDALSTNENGAVPVGVRRYIALLALERESRMRRLQFRVEQSVAALGDAGIDVLLLKGAALACTVYPSFAARPMRDVDLLVRAEQGDKAQAVMRELGWIADATLPVDRSYETHQHLPPLRDAVVSDLRVEIHRAVLPTGHPFRCVEAAIWRDALDATLGTTRVSVMHPVHHAVYAAIHFSWSHMFGTGTWHTVRDLATLAATRDFTWSRFAATATEWRATNCCYWTLLLGRQLSGLQFPPDLLEQLRPAVPWLLHGPLWRHFHSRALRGGDEGCPSARLEQALWSIAMRPRRAGHGGVRPWLVSLDLLLALDGRSASSDHGPAAFWRRMRRSGVYLSRILTESS